MIMPRFKRACRRRFRVYLLLDILLGLFLVGLYLGIWAGLIVFPLVLVAIIFISVGIPLFFILLGLIFIQRISCLARL